MAGIDPFGGHEFCSRIMKRLMCSAWSCQSSHLLTALLFSRPVSSTTNATHRGWSSSFAYCRPPHSKLHSLNNLLSFTTFAPLYKYYFIHITTSRVLSGSLAKALQYFVFIETFTCMYIALKWQLLLCVYGWDCYFHLPHFAMINLRHQ